MDTIWYFSDNVFIIAKKIYLTNLNDTDTRTGTSPTAFHQTDDASDNFIFLIAFIE